MTSMGLGDFGGAQVRNVATEPDGTSADRVR